MNSGQEWLHGKICEARQTREAVTEDPLQSFVLPESKSEDRQRLECGSVAL